MTLYALGDLRPTLPEDGDCWIAPGAHVIGDVILHPGVSVWFGCTLRGDNEPIEVGHGSNVQENCVMHTDPGFPLRIGAGCTIGHKAMLHGCTIGDGALIGMGATVLNGAVIGAGALVGAGAVVTEGKTIPEGMLALGAPARPVRPLDEEARRMMRRAAEHYQTRMRDYRARLRAID